MTDEFGFFDGEFFVGFDVDFAGFFEGFLVYEGGHFFELGCDLCIVSSERGDSVSELERTWSSDMA